MGITLLVLTLAALAFVAGALGGPPTLAAALDPARSGSVPDLWGQLLLAVTVLALLRRHPSSPGARLAALVPLALLLADATDLSTHLAGRLAPFPPAMAADDRLVLAKLAAGAILGCVAATPALLLWRRSCLVQHELGRRLVLLLLSGGSAALLLDAVGAPDGYVATIAEEAVEVILYAAVAARLLEHAARHGRSNRLDLRPCAAATRT
jgi:hypothetical protein